MPQARDVNFAFTPGPNASAVFQSYDLDGNGLVSREELATSLQSLAAKHNLVLPPEKITAMTEAIFQSAKSDLAATSRGTRNSHLSPAEWNALSRSVLERRMSYAVITDVEDKTYFGKLADFYSVYKQQIWWTVWFYALQVILFGIGVQRFLTSGKPPSIQAMVSLGFAQVLLVDVTIFVFLPAYRFLLTRLRGTFFASFIPFDNWISFHIIVGFTTALMAVMHAGLYMLKFYYDSQTPAYIALNRTFHYIMTEPGFVGSAWMGYTATSGLTMLGCLTIMVFFALPPIRNSRLYDLFYWTHKLQYVIWSALIVHSGLCWKFLVGPLSFMLFEKTLKYYNTLRWSKTTRIIEVNLLPTNVTQLVVTRPADFEYNPGDYVYIRVPRLGFLSWHPFTLTSCPEQKDVLWFHIKASGNWTTELREFFNKKANEQVELQTARNTPSPVAGTSASQPHDDLHMQPVVPTLRHIPNLDMNILLDGPYGASTTAIFNAEHVVLIGGGIGVTPFASVLGSVLAQFRENQGSTGMRINHQKLKMKKLDFIWVSRESENVQWFIDLLEGWEEQQQSMPADKLFMDCQLYMTSIPNKKESTIAGLSIGMDLHHKIHNKDVITGLRTSTKTGRPDWPTVFAKIDRHKQGSVRVFYCGPHALERKIRFLAGQYKFKFSREQF